MNRKFRVIGFLIRMCAVWATLATGLWAQSANVGCGYVPTQRSAPAIKPASFVMASSHGRDSDTIVGLWKFEFLSKGNPGIADGTVIDQGLAMWHSDGTEMMNSGLRPPMTGNFCMGVWEQTGNNTYKLNHIGLSWDPTGTTFVGPASIKVQATLSPDGNTYAGKFVLNQYDTNGNLLVHLTGTVGAKRITAD